MEDKHQPVSATIKGQEELAANIAQQQQFDNFSTAPPPKDSNVGPPKVTVSLPKHAASRLLDLVQKRDISLLSLGIISVQFEDDQIIPLEPAPSLDSTSIIIKEDPKGESTPPTSPPPLTAPPHQLTQPATSSTSNITTSTSVATTTSITSTSTSNTIVPHIQPLPKSDCNSNSLAPFVDDDEDEDKDESEVVNEVENQHSSFNIHPLSQFELEMYDNDNILFSDYI